MAMFTNTLGSFGALGALGLASLLALPGCAAPRFGPWQRATSFVRASTQTLAIVRVRTPWYAPSFVVRSRFRGAVPEYEAIAALDHKYYIVTDDGRFGGIYVWRSRGDAQAYYSDTWRRGIRERRGADPELLLLEVTAVIEGRARVEGEPLGARSLSFPAFATLSLWSLSRHAQRGAISAPAVDFEGMIRAFELTTDGQIGFVAVWATRAHAEAALAHERLSSFGAPQVSAFFEVPVLMDADVRARRAPQTVSSVARAESP